MVNRNFYKNLAVSLSALCGVSSVINFSSSAMEDSVPKKGYEKALFKIKKINTDINTEKKDLQKMKCMIEELAGCFYDLGTQGGFDKDNAQAKENVSTIRSCMKNLLKTIIEVSATNDPEVRKINKSVEKLDPYKDMPKINFLTKSLTNKQLKNQLDGFQCGEMARYLKKLLGMKILIPIPGSIFCLQVPISPRLSYLADQYASNQNNDFIDVNGYDGGIEAFGKIEGIKDNGSIAISDLTRVIDIVEKKDEKAFELFLNCNEEDLKNYAKQKKRPCP